MIAVIDYGMGNLRSVQKAFEYLGFKAIITDDTDTVLNAESVVLPGVGAISDALHRLTSRGMDKVIEEVIHQNKPFLGICLGMQLLFERSHEGGLFEGFKIINGEVVRLPYINGLKVPHMGWNRIIFEDDPLFYGLSESVYAYFVHSYYVGTSIAESIATTNYGIDVTAAVRKNKVYGVQFHPEKSGDVGLRILNNFGRMK